MSKTIKSKVAGVTKKNEDGENRQDIIEAFIDPGDELYLEREPYNDADPNAIAVSSHYGQIGYLRAELAEELAPSMDAGQLVIANVLEKTGGDEGRSYGVNLKIVVFSPEETAIFNQRERELKALHQYLLEKAVKEAQTQTASTAASRAKGKPTERRPIKIPAALQSANTSTMILIGGLVGLILACLMTCCVVSFSVMIAGAP